MSADEARAGESVIITLEDEIDISRGDMIVRPNNLPNSGNVAEAYICWMHDVPLEKGKPYIIQHTTNSGMVHISTLNYRIDVDTLHREDAEQLALNEIGLVELVSAKPLNFDPYRLNHDTGSFILIDPATNVTLAAGMIRGSSATVLDSKGEESSKLTISRDVVWTPYNVPREEREKRNGHKGAAVWFTGLSGSGKSTIAAELEKRLFNEGRHTMLLDGDQLRHGLSGDLGFTNVDREENIRRVAHVSRLFVEHGDLTVCTFISPFAQDRAFARSLVPEDHFVEVFVDTPLEVCIERDPKGLYKKAKDGQIPNFTGVTSPYEKPEKPEITIRTSETSVEDAVEQIVAFLKYRGILPN